MARLICKAESKSKADYTVNVMGECGTVSVGHIVYEKGLWFCYNMTFKKSYSVNRSRHEAIAFFKEMYAC